MWATLATGVRSWFSAWQMLSQGAGAVLCCVDSEALYCSLPAASDEPVPAHPEAQLLLPALEATAIASADVPTTRRRQTRHQTR